MAIKNPNTVNATSCPVCRAQPNQPCKMLIGREKPNMHRARINKLADLLAKLASKGIHPLRPKEAK